MSTFKEYARRAKERMKSGFWENARERLQHEREVAATTGVNQCKLNEEHRRRIVKQIYDYDGFCEEQEFYCKVVDIITGDEVVTNPIMRLADEEYMARLTPADKQVYISKVAAKYRAAVDRYNSLHSR